MAIGTLNTTYQTNNQVNGTTMAGEHVSSAFEFITIATSVNVLLNGDVNGGTAVSQAALDKLIEIVSLRGQPVVLGIPTVAGGTYTVNLFTEHAMAWSNATPTLAATILSAGIDVGFAANGVTTTVTFGGSYSY